MKKILVAYYSRTEENYVNGGIVRLPKGNTAIAAEKIEALAGGDLFEIKTIRKRITEEC
ncbi:hypothetical protein [Treponema brennaborense]|uniref:Uncharacterized protein n=1 Tax=Treponema brennaborense (strain DSM 12168 / CIP 105900 / DD5/3) TaxID=906968 RepID=F4LNG0_TREBD|nr:hypothetical protein [Treponema brennaborense]AEE17918.1 hypothetical protein Trebr_2512 [Treponema brennaborense DSM 12168]